MTHYGNVGKDRGTSLIPFDPISEPTSLSQRWKAWKRRFEIYLIVVNVQNNAQKRALLLYQVGKGNTRIL